MLIVQAKEKALSPVYKIMDSGERYYEPPDDGLLMTRSLADDLNARAGGTLGRITQIRISTKLVSSKASEGKRKTWP